MARPPRQPQTRINRRIRFPQVRVIGADGSQLGVMATRDAIRIAEEDGLDLVEMSPDARPPVCRILDYGKHRYDESKNARKAKKRQVATQLKEMRYRPKIDEHDVHFKTERLRQFLTDGHKVRAYVEFRGREMTHTEFGYRILERIKEQLSDVGQPEASVRMEGRHMSLIINPKRVPKPKGEGSGGRSKKPRVEAPKPDPEAKVETPVPAAVPPESDKQQGEAPKTESSAKAEAAAPAAPEGEKSPAESSAGNG